MPLLSQEQGQTLPNAGAKQDLEEDTLESPSFGEQLGYFEYLEQHLLPYSPGQGCGGHKQEKDEALGQGKMSCVQTNMMVLV